MCKNYTLDYQNVEKSCAKLKPGVIILKITTKFYAGDKYYPQIYLVFTGNHKPLRFSASAIDSHFKFCATPKL